ncbi:MAG: pitrilysin family protein [Planctomycetota bacterium]|nr:pitrilysin family protein [Planctomycetota bacterium]
MMTALSFFVFIGPQILGFGGSQDGFQALADEVEVRELDNGLRVIVLPFGDAPVAAFRVTVNTGGMDEELGLTGLAHFAEHMAFKGSRRIGSKDWASEKRALEECDRAWKLYEAASTHQLGNISNNEIQQLLASFESARAEADRFSDASAFDTAVSVAGGLDQNASTGADSTEYHVSLPVAQMERWFWLTREQLGDPVMREFYKERDVVMEERRMRTDSNAFGSLLEAVLQSAFVAHPYRDPVIGHMDDLEYLDRPEMLAFWKRHYTAERMVVTVVGKVEPDDVFALAEKYFGDLPRGKKSRIRRTQEPAQKGERTVRVIRPTSPMVLIAWHVPEITKRNKLLYAALGDLLWGGPSSRWYQRLVKEERISAEVDGWLGYPGRVDPTLLLMVGVPVPGHTGEEIVRIAQEEIERLAAEGPTVREMGSLRRRAKMELLQRLESAQGLAGELAQAELFDGGWETLFQSLDVVELLTADDLKKAAAGLNPLQRVVGLMHDEVEVGS